MTIQDQVVSALTAWRENRQSGQSGLQSILNVIQNRAKKTGDDPYTVCTTHEQFSSISMPGPEDILWPTDSDPQWQTALALAAQAAAGTLADLTGGSTLYYAPASIPSGATITLPSGTTVPFPKGWNPDVVTYQATIGGQLFFTEA
jgi:type II secretory pathway pseudopilin PulG